MDQQKIIDTIGAEIVHAIGQKAGEVASLEFILGHMAPGALGESNLFAPALQALERDGKIRSMRRGDHFQLLRADSPRLST